MTLSYNYVYRSHRLSRLTYSEDIQYTGPGTQPTTSSASAENQPEPPILISQKRPPVPERSTHRLLYSTRFVSLYSPLDTTRTPVSRSLSRVASGEEDSDRVFGSRTERASPRTHHLTFPLQNDYTCCHHRPRTPMRQPLTVCSTRGSPPPPALRKPRVPAAGPSSSARCRSPAQPAPLAAQLWVYLYQ